MPWWRALPMWLAVLALGAWGIWQFGEFRHKLLADARSEEVEATMPGAGGVNGLAAGADSDGGDGSTVEITPSVETGPRIDPWAVAMRSDAEGEDEGARTAAGSVGAGGESTVGMLRADQADERPPTEWVKRGRQLLAAGRIVEGREALNAALQNWERTGRAPTEAAGLRSELAALNRGVFLGTAVIPGDAAAPLIELRPGDTFLRLGHAYAVPATLLEAVNPSLNPRDLRPGTGVKVVRGPFHALFRKGARRMDVYARDIYVESMPAEVAEGDFLAQGTYRVKRGAKIKVQRREWIGLEPLAVSPDATGVEGPAGPVWIYGTAGPRRGRLGAPGTGVKVADSDLSELYNVLAEGRSLVKVEP